MTIFNKSLFIIFILATVICSGAQAHASRLVNVDSTAGDADSSGDGVSPFDSAIGSAGASPVSRLYFGPNFPLPASLAPNVDFWIDVYSRYTTSQWLIHDKNNLSVVYEVVNVDEALPGVNPNSKAAEKYTSNRRKYIAGILRNLYKNRGAASTAEEARIANALPFRPKNSSYYLELANGVRSQRGQADRFLEGLRRSGMYSGHMRQVFRQYGLPVELTALPHVESSFNYAAYSKVGAAGIWQFTRGTGKKFMRIDSVADERRDPLISTHAAARLLKINYETLGYWPLAVIAYNHGLNGMSRAVTRHGADLVEIIDSYQSKAFGFASKNFYAEFLAALEVSRNHEKYFGPVDFMPESRFDEITLTRSISTRELAKLSGVDGRELEPLNKALSDAVWRGRYDIPKGYRIKIPEGKSGLVVASLEKSSSAPAVESAPEELEIAHLVRRGETPSGIASAYGIGVRELMSVNGISSRGLIAGRKIIIPSPTKMSSRGSRVLINNDTNYYFVKEGDSLSSISQDRNIPEGTLAMINGLSKDTEIFPGQKLLVKKEMAIIPTRYENAFAPTVIAGDDRGILVNTPDAASANVGAITNASAPAAGPDFLVLGADEMQDDAGWQDMAKAAAGEKTLAANTDQSSAVRDNFPSIDPKVYSIKSVKGNVATLSAGPEETVALYAKWAGVSARAIRKMNDGKKNPIIGAQVKVPLGRTSPEQFERRRQEFHSTMLAKFMENYEFKDEKTVTVKPGKSVWRLCVLEHKTPLWLVMLYNPDKEIRNLLPGDTLTLPTFIRK
ncbi:MAG: LysM peptidoglycan-binding domain-containing protein [Nitrospinota bacterium]|nr:LysM peptidoglycan-binding domain-containing protein [Nitrospinota bacterium]